MSCVSLTQRISKSKFQTIIYYKPELNLASTGEVGTP